MAERLLQALLDSRSPGAFAVRSAGTAALVGHPIHPRVAQELARKGVDPNNFAAQALTPELLQEQDIILALSKRHRSAVVELSPSTLRRTFTLVEFARLLSNIKVDSNSEPSARWLAAIPKAIRARSANMKGPGDDDIIDPYGREEAVFQEMFSKLTDSVDQINAQLIAEV
jgi:protein-tyrosine phosphatase